MGRPAGAGPGITHLSITYVPTHSAWFREWSEESLASVSVWVLEEAGTESAQGSEGDCCVYVCVSERRASAGLGVQNQKLWACGWLWTRQPGQTHKEGMENEKRKGQSRTLERTQMWKGCEATQAAKVVQDLDLIEREWQRVTCPSIKGVSSSSHKSWAFVFYS